MNPPTVGRNILRRSRSSITLFVCVVMGVFACGGSESSEAAASAPSGSAGVLASPEAGSIAPLGTGFIMVSARSQLRLEEPSYVEQTDCMARVSALGDGKEYAGCMEIPRAANCLQVTVGFQESDSWWECFVEPVVCEDRTAEHDMLWQLVKDARAILQPCAETELASVFGSVF
jgi:hypothetical protein